MSLFNYLFRRRANTRALNILLVTNGLVLIAGAMLGPIYALFVKDVGGDLLDASLAGAVFAASAGVTAYVSGRFADRMKRGEFVIVAGYLMMGVGYLVLTQASSIGHLLFAQVVIGIGEAVYSPAFDGVYSRHLTKHAQGSEWGRWEMMNYFTIAGGALVGGIIVTLTSFDTIFVVMALLCIGSASYIVSLRKHIL
ncbi:MAG: MFS transporter [Patescibacteria group bacterium]